MSYLYLCNIFLRFITNFLISLHRCSASISLNPLYLSWSVRVCVCCFSYSHNLLHFRFIVSLDSYPKDFFYSRPNNCVSLIFSFAGESLFQLLREWKNECMNEGGMKIKKQRLMRGNRHFKIPPHLLFANLALIAEIDTRWISFEMSGLVRLG